MNYSTCDFINTLTDIVYDAEFLSVFVGWGSVSITSFFHSLMVRLSVPWWLSRGSVMSSDDTLNQDHALVSKILLLKSSCPLGHSVCAPV